MEKIEGDCSYFSFSLNVSVLFRQGSAPLQGGMTIDFRMLSEKECCTSGNE